MDLNQFMRDGVKDIVSTASRYYLHDARGRAWLAGAVVGIRGALESPFFARVREVEAAHADEHLGGCTLFLHREEVLRSAAAAKD